MNMVKQSSSDDQISQVELSNHSDVNFKEQNTLNTSLSLVFSIICIIGLIFLFFKYGQLIQKQIQFEEKLTTLEKLLNLQKIQQNMLKEIENKSIKDVNIIKTVQKQQQNIQSTDAIQTENKIINNKIHQKQVNKQNQYDKTIDKNNLQKMSKQLWLSKNEIKPQLKIAQADRKVTAVFTSCKRYDLLNGTLASFFKINTFPIEKTIVIEDGPSNPQFIQIKNLYPNVTWMTTDNKVGQIVAVDMAYKMVDTPFVFHSQDDWEFTQPGFIQTSFDYFQRIPKLLQTWIKITKRAINTDTRIMLDSNFGFSFNPSLKKMALYRQDPTGYQGITKNVSFGSGAGIAEIKLVKYYQQKGYLVAQAQTNYIKHTGQNRGLPKIFRG